MKEAGADVEAVLWSGIFVPAATPPEIVRKLEAEFIRIARLPDVVSRLKLLNIDSVGNSSEEFSRIIAADLERWRDGRPRRQYQDGPVERCARMTVTWLSDFMPMSSSLAQVRSD